MTRLLCLALVGILHSAPLRARTLGEFSCQRPRPVDAGTWHNVSLAAAALNGVSLTPGAELSFTRSMLPLWEAGLFREGRTLSRGRVVMTKGGGYCQVSTALYNAALLAGLSVVERHTHSFYDAEDAYVEPGMDAAISREGKKDLVIANQRAYPVTLRASAQDWGVRIEILGPGKPRRRWLRLVPEKRPRPEKVVDADAEPESALAEGADGWKVIRFLDWVDDAGNTRSTRLNNDYYAPVPREVRRPRAAPGANFE